MSTRRLAARQWIEQRGQRVCRNGHSSVLDSEEHLLVIAHNFQTDGTGAMLNCIIQQIDEQLAYAGTVPHANETSRHMHVDLRIGRGSAHFFSSIPAYAPKVLFREINGKPVSEARSRENEEIVDQHFHSFGASLQAGARPQANGRKVFVL